MAAWRSCLWHDPTVWGTHNGRIIIGGIDVALCGWPSQWSPASNCGDVRLMRDADCVGDSSDDGCCRQVLDRQQPVTWLCLLNARVYVCALVVLVVGASAAAYRWM